MTFRIVRMWDASMDQVGRLTQPAWERYAERHGYYIADPFLWEKPVSNDWTVHMGKIWVVKRSTSEDFIHDWTFWVDADAIVTNQEIQLDQFVSGEMDRKQLVFARDNNGLCSGVFFARRTQRCKSMLDAILAIGEPSNDIHRALGGIDAHEQNTIKALADSFPAFGEDIAHVPNLQFYPRIHRPGDFILHAAQRTNEERIKLLTPFA